MFGNAVRLLCIVAGSLAVVLAADRVRAQTPADMQAAISKTCAVMSGERKPDPQALQLLLLLDGDMADANPVEIGLYRGVLQQCPKAYLGYEQRLRAHNPFANGSLVHGQTQLVTGGATLTRPATTPDFPLRCRGGNGIASAQGSTLVVKFAKAPQVAVPSLHPGQCSWSDRVVRSNEPVVIDAVLPSTAAARNGVAQINAGGTWTFWVVNATTYLRTTVIAKGTPAKKP
jgi:hypothetical protein